MGFKELINAHKGLNRKKKMAIQETIYYTAICDGCKKEWYNDHHGWSAMNDEAGLKEMLSNDEWHLDDGKTYCPSCFTIDDDDNVLINSNITE